jgi:LPS-assembly protein
VRRVTDTRYFEDFGNSLNSAATSFLPSSIYLTGRGPWWNMSFGADRTQLTDPLVPASAEPYERLPRFTLDAEHTLGPDWLAAGLRTELVHFDKDDAVSGERYDWYPYVALPFETAAWFVRPEVGWRYTSYQLDRELDDSPTRETPIASLDAGIYADRAVEWFGHSWTQTLEPRLYYLYVPERDQDDIPIFDTQELTFGFAELFRPNRFSGADRQTDANQVTLAVSSRLIEDESGKERARLSLGQIRYFDPPEVEVPGVVPLRRSESAFVGELEVHLNDRWSAAVANQYDPKLEHTDFGSVRLQRRWGTEGVANLDYRYRRDQLEQLDLTTAIPINDSWKLVGRYDYSIKDSKVLEAFAGFEYDSCCYAVRLVGRHYVRNVEGESNDALYFEIELKGLGGVGRASEEFLKKAIQGYR